MSTIVVLAILLIVLVVFVVMFSGRAKNFRVGLDTISETKLCSDVGSGCFPAGTSCTKAAGGPFTDCAAPSVCCASSSGA